MSAITREKLAQAAKFVPEFGFDAWITFVRETSDAGDPVLPLLIESSLTWTSALIVTTQGKKIAVLGNYDADVLVGSGDWDEVVPYVQGIRTPLLEKLDELITNPNPKIAVNFSTSDDKADGLTHGMFLVLQDLLIGTRFENSLVSAEKLVSALRGRKSRAEIDAMKLAIKETDRLFDEVSDYAKVGMTERSIYRFVQERIRDRGFGFAWDPVANPIVNSGPNSMIGHGIASDSITLEPGHIFHIDLGIRVHGYSSDIQRCWFVTDGGSRQIPDDVERAREAVIRSIDTGASKIRPGAQGWQVDAAARESLVADGYEEYLHAYGHQVGQLAHDGGGILGPRWERYGALPTLPIEKDQVYTAELGVILKDRGYLGFEEMLVVTDSGFDWITARQLELWTI